MEVSTMCGRIFFGIFYGYFMGSGTYGSVYVYVYDTDVDQRANVVFSCLRLVCSYSEFKVFIRIQNLRLVFISEFEVFIRIIQNLSLGIWNVGKEKREADCNSIFVRPASIQGKNIKEEPFSWKP